MNNTEKPNPENETTIETSRENIRDLYNEAAPIYDEEFEGKAEYKVPGLLIEMYKKHNITGGSVLDIGCGTGKLREYLGDDFTYTGIDLSEEMSDIAMSRGYKVYTGLAEDLIKGLGNKSIDHVVIIGSAYFIKNFPELVKEMERVARKSIFVSLERFDSHIIEKMKDRGINIYNHDKSVFSDGVDVIENTFLWRSPSGDDEVFGDVVFEEIG